MENNNTKNYSTWTRSDILRNTTMEYLESLDRQNLPTLREISTRLVNRTAEAVERHNSRCPESQRIPVPLGLCPAQIADVILAVRHVVRVSYTVGPVNNENDLLAIYQEGGQNEGIYLSQDEVFDNIAQELNYAIDMKGKREVRENLFQNARCAAPCSNPDLVAVNNGIFDYKNKTLMPFSPEYIFLSKSRVDYKENPESPRIHRADDNTDWDVESWVAELSDDPEIVGLLWEIMGAIIRPNVRWNKSAWFYSSTGCNGKGTLCELMRNLCGKGSSVSIKLADFSREFRLAPLVHASAIITDENDTGEIIDRAGNLKAVITNDVIQINRKFRQPVDYRFRGFMVQCVNEMPKVRDKSDSFYRRQLLVPFGKCFTGAERTYIKDEYMGRKDVLEYVLHKVLNMDYYKLSEPRACKWALADYRELNDPVREFWNELRDRFVWDLLPNPFLYELYRAWTRKNTPSSPLLDNKPFHNELRKLVEADPDWAALENPATPGGKLNKPESLILEYNLADWGAKEQSAIPPQEKQQKTCRGLRRVRKADSAVA